MEAENLIKQNKPNFLVQSDSGWIEKLSGCPISEHDEQWFATMNQLIYSASKPLNSSPIINREAINNDRNIFFQRLTHIYDVASNKFYEPGRMPKPDTFVETARLLDENGVDVQKAFTMAPEIMGYKKASIESKLRYLESQGVDIAIAVTKFSPLLLFTINALSDKIANLQTADIDIANTVTVHPNILALAPDTINSKLQFLSDIGLDAQSVINKNPRLITLSERNLATKMNAMYAAAKSWGIAEYKTYVNELVETWPTILGYKATKIRTIAKIASFSIDNSEIDKLNLYSTTSNAMTSRLEAVVVAYLNKEISQPSDLYIKSRKYKNLSLVALKSIIGKHTSDPVVKTYLRGYTI
jgi:hypothetical protein